MNRFLQFSVFVSLCCVLLFAVSCTSIAQDNQASEVPAKPAIVIDAKTILGPVNRKVFGQVVRGADRKDVFTDTHDQYITNQSEGMWDPEHRRPSTNAIAFLKGVNPTILRYPDGLNTQGHDWKKTVGPISERPNFQFGLDEYMQVCKAAGAQAQIVVTEYIGTTQDLADMVEYLNMPATAKYPWAQKRSQWGHVEPYGVKYFELGNESWVKKLKGRGAERHNEYTYAKYAKDAIVAMKKVDPTIQIGVVLMNYPEPASHPWNKQVLGAVGDLMDFGITHTYCVGYKGNDMDVDEDRILSAVLPASEQLEYWLRELRHRIYKETGRNIPLAITEFNGMFVQNKPKQYIHSYAPAFFNAEYLHILLKPENNIILANYWQFFNSYFGMVQGKTDESLLAMPAYPLFRLWADHFGDQLIKVDVRGEPRVSSQGFGHTAPAKGDRYQPTAAVEGGDLLSQGIPNLDGMAPKWRDKTQKQGPRSLTIQLDQVTKIRYPNLFKVQLPKVLRPTQGAVQYQISFEMRFVSDTNQPAKLSLGLGISDGRGWTKQIHSAVAATASGVDATWQYIESTLKPLPDIDSILVLARLECGKEPVSGRLEIRNLQLQVVSSEIFPAYAALTASASRSDDGKTIYLIVFNKHPENDIEATIDLKGMKYKSARFWQVSNPPLNAFNTPEQQLVKLIVDGQAMPMTKHEPLTHLFPTRSMTAIELVR